MQLSTLQATSTALVPRPPVTGWTRFLLPSVADLIFVALLFSLSCSALAARLLGDAGIGWHIRNGQQMLFTHVITRTDSFSSTMNGKPWFAWEWLYDLLAASVHQTSGLNGVVFLTALVVAVTFALVFRLTLAGGGNLPITVLLLALSMGAAAIHLFARPHVFSWLLTVTWFHLLDSWDAGTAESGANRRLLWLPALMVVWVNLHGGFVTGFILLGVYLAAACIDYLRSPGEGAKAILRKLRALGAATALSLFATLINPYGYKLHIHIYQYLSDRFLMNHIQEFASPNFHGAAERCFAILLLITIIALASAKQRPRISQLLVIVFAAGSGLYASRSLPVSALLLTMLVTPVLSESMARAGENLQVIPWLRRIFSRWTVFAERMATTEMSLAGHLWPAMAVAAGLWVCVHGGRLGQAQLIDAHFPAKRFPVQAVDVIANLGIHDPVFCPDYWGGYLIYRLYPGTKVVVDDRHDLYGAEFLKQYLKTDKGEPGWDELLTKEHVTAVLEPAGSPLANLLALTPGWRITYQDDIAVFFQR